MAQWLSCSMQAGTGVSTLLKKKKIRLKHQKSPFEYKKKLLTKKKTPPFITIQALFLNFQCKSTHWRWDYCIFNYYD